MTWEVIARKEFRDSIRARSLWAVGVVFTLVMLLITYVYGYVLAQTPRAEMTGSALVSIVSGEASGFYTPFIAIIGLLLGYASVVDERDSGTAKFLLGLPHSRLDVVIGKVLGRTAVLAAAFATGFVLSGLLLIGYESPDIVTYGGFAVLTTFLAAIFLCIGVALSSSIESRRRVTAATIAVFFVLMFLWDTSIIPRLIVYLFTGEVGGSELIPYLVATSPSSAYSNVAASLFSSEGPAGVGGVEIYSGIVFVSWAVVSVAFGYLRFRKASI